MAEGLKGLATGEVPLICGADSKNWEAMTELAKQYKAALSVSTASLDEMADLTEKIKAKGVEDLVLDPQARHFGWIARAEHPDPPSGAEEELPPSGISGHSLPQDAGGCHPGDCEICRLCRPGRICARVGLSVAGSTAKYLYRSAKTDPGPTGRL